MTALTPVVNKHGGAPFDVYVGRGSRFGNPFPMNSTPAGTRQAVILAYEQHLLAMVASDPSTLEHLRALHGKRLQCFCAPRQCHGDVLAHYADALALTGALPTATAYSVIYPQP